MVPPDAAYLGYVDFRTLALLYCLMVVVAGLRRAGVFAWLAHKLCAGAGSLRAIGFTLVLLSFFSSMLITNDVALLTFVPFAVVVLGMAHQEKALIWVVVMQTAAANLGSMLTPVGNPQNIYLFSRYGFSLGSFLSVTLPIWLISLVLISLLCLRLPKERLGVFLGEEPLLDKTTLTLYVLLFLLCICTVLRLLTWQIMLALVILVLLIFDRPRAAGGRFLAAAHLCVLLHLLRKSCADGRGQGAAAKSAARARAADRCSGEPGHKQCTGGAPTLRLHG